MARLTIDAGTIFYDYPRGFDIVSESTVTDIESINIAGRMGRYIRSYGNPIGQKVIVISGRLHGVATPAGPTAAVDLDEKTAKLMRAHSFGAAMALTDNTLSRHATVWLAGIRYTDRKHAHIREVTIRLIAPLGVWGLDDALVPSVTTAAINSTKLVRYAHPVYAGSVPGPAQILIKPTSSTWPVSGDGEIRWRGRNLLVNSSFEDGVGAAPDAWDRVSTPQVVEGFGRTGHRCVKLITVGGAADYYSQSSIPCDAATEYTFSAYFAQVPPTSSGVSVRIVVQSRDAALGFLSNTQTTEDVTSSSWQRISTTHTTHALAASISVHARILDADGEVYHDDAQLERAGTPSEFVNTSEPRFRHVVFKLQNPAQLAQATGDALSVDCALGRTRRLRSGSWQENNHEVNGHYFELLPGLNHIEFSPPTAGNLDVEIRHRDLFL